MTNLEALKGWLANLGATEEEIAAAGGNLEAANAIIAKLGGTEQAASNAEAIQMIAALAGGSGGGGGAIEYTLERPYVIKKKEGVSKVDGIIYMDHGVFKEGKLTNDNPEIRAMGGQYVEARLSDDEITQWSTLVYVITDSNVAVTVKPSYEYGYYETHKIGNQGRQIIIADSGDNDSDPPTEITLG